MKKNFFFGILFIAILTINFISFSETNVSDQSLRSIMQNAKADGVEACYTSADYYYGWFRVVTGGHCYDNNNVECGTEQDCLEISPSGAQQGCYYLQCS